MEETAEYTTSTSKTEIRAYVVMLHLVHQKSSTFPELAKLLDIHIGHNLSENILGYIVQKIEQLEKDWGESIPQINVLVFKDPKSVPKDRGKVSGWACEHLTGNEDTQPTLKQISELTASVATYDKWDKVLAAFKPEM